MERTIDRALVDRVMELKPAERMRLLNVIYGSLERPDTAIDEIWYDEAERRLAAYKAGDVKGIPADRPIRCLARSHDLCPPYKILTFWSHVDDVINETLYDNNDWYAIKYHLCREIVLRRCPRDQEGGCNWDVQERLVRLFCPPFDDPTPYPDAERTWGQ